MTKPPLDGEDFDSLDDDYNNYEEDEPAPNYASARSAQAGEHCERSWAHSNTQLIHTNKKWNSPGFLPLGASQFDSLYLTFHGDLTDSRRDELHALRNKAKDKNQAHEAQIQLNNYLFKVLKNGRNGYLYVLQGDFFEIEIGHKPEVTNRPVAGVKIYARWLLCSCPLDIECLVRAVLMTLCKSLDKASPSRADIRFDFCTTDSVIENFELSQIICANGHLSPHVNNRVIGTWCAGMGTDVVTRVYNKSKHLLTGKATDTEDLLPELWKIHGWDGQRTVWRCELQFRKPPMKECGINTLEDLIAHRNGLWEKYARSNMRVVIPSDTDKTVGRWPLHPLWSDIIEAGISDKDFIRLVRKRPTYKLHYEKTFVRWLGSTGTMIAIDDVATDPDLYVENYLVQKMRNEILSSGMSALDYLKLVVKKKRQILNIGLNEQSLLPTHKSFEARKSPASKYNELLAGQGDNLTDEEDEES